MTPNPKPWYVRHHDDEILDEVRVQTVPRYKTSGLSGDEWRVSARVQFLRKGVVIVERWFTTIEAAVQFIPAMRLEMLDNGVEPSWHMEEKCFQPGCSEDAVSEYRLKEEYTPQGTKVERLADFDMRRRFCVRHARRGDCGLDDGDANYEVISGPGPDAADGWEEDVSESAQVVIEAKDMADAAAKVAELHKQLKSE